MRAIGITRFGGPGVLELLDLPVPRLGPGEILVEVAAAGVNPVDVLFRDGTFPSGPGRLPIIMGVDLAGVVSAVGPQVEGFAPGDAVYAHKPGGHGTYAEYAAIPAAWTALKPTSLSFTEAAAVPCAGLTAYQALVEALEVGQGERLIIVGASGGVGSFAVQIAVALGAHVVAVSSARNHDFLRGLGAADVIDYAAEDALSTLASRYPGGVDAALATVGHGKEFAARSVRRGGRFLWISSEDPGPPAIPSGVRGQMFYARADGRSLGALANLIDRRLVRPIVSQVLPLECAADAHRQIETGHTRGKLVLQVRPGADSPP